MERRLNAWLLVLAEVPPSAHISGGDYVELEVEDEPVAQVSDFAYLGATISCDGTIDRDLDV